MVELKGILYRKIRELSKARKREEKHIERDITKETQQAVEELEAFMRRNRKKSEHLIDAKFNHILKNLQVLNKTSKMVVKQNQKLIGLLNKRKRITLSI